MAQLVKWLILDFGSGHDLGVVESSPVSGSAWILLGILSPSAPLLLLSLFQINKIFLKKIILENSVTSLEIKINGRGTTFLRVGPPREIVDYRKSLIKEHRPHRAGNAQT